MPFSVTCPNCDAELTIPDEVAGKKIRCEACSEAFRAEPPSPEKKTTKPARVTDDDDAPNKYGTSMNPLLFVGVTLLLVIVVLSVGVYLIYRAVNADPKASDETPANYQKPYAPTYGQPPAFTKTVFHLEPPRVRLNEFNGGSDVILKYEIKATGDPQTQYIIYAVYEKSFAIRQLAGPMVALGQQGVFEFCIAENRPTRIEIWVGQAKSGGAYGEVETRVSEVLVLEVPAKTTPKR